MFGVHVTIVFSFSTLLRHVWKSVPKQLPFRRLWPPKREKTLPKTAPTINKNVQNARHCYENDVLFGVLVSRFGNFSRCLDPSLTSPPKPGPDPKKLELETQNKRKQTQKQKGSVVQKNSMLFSGSGFIYSVLCFVYTHVRVSIEVVASRARGIRSYFHSISKYIQI